MKLNELIYKLIKLKEEGKGDYVIVAEYDGIISELLDDEIIIFDDKQQIQIG